MASRYPLVINNSTSLVGELPTGDSLNLSATGIFDGISTGANKQVLTSTGAEVRWARAADVFLDDNQTLLNKTLSSCTFNASLNTLTNVANASLLNSSISINGSNVPLGGSITIPDTNDNTIYAISVADGTSGTQKRIRLTAGGSGSGFQDIFLVAGYNTTITRSGNDTLEIATGLTQLRAPDSSPYIEGQITILGSGGTRVSQNLQTITVDSDPFPIGGIIMWSGSINSIPTKWALCDGSTVNGIITPDLRNRFIIGAGENYTVASSGGSKDAILVSHQHTGTTGTESQSHTHSGTTGSENQSHTHSGTTGNNSVGHTHSGTTGTESASHSHSGSTNTTGGHSHGGSTSGAGSVHAHNFNTGGASNNHTHGYQDRGYNSGSTGKQGGPGWATQGIYGFDFGRATDGISSGHFHGGTTSYNGGSHSHNIGTDTRGDHSHNVSIGNQSANHTHNFNTGGVSTNHTHNFNSGNASQTHTHNITTGNTSQSHTHNITVSTQGVDGTDKNLPPYYALAYIIKVQ
jgi:hypothetical protein